MNNILYFNMFICVFLLSFIIAIADKKIKNKKIRLTYSVILILLYSLIIAIRPFTIPDTFAYYDKFQKIDLNINYGFSIINEYSNLDIEYGFLYFMKLIKYLGGNYLFFFYIQSIVCTLLMLLGIYNINRYLEYEKRINIPLFLCIYFSFYGMYYQGIAIRAGIAIALGFTGISYGLLHKNIKSFFIIILSLCFHRMGIISFFVLIFLKIVPVFSIKIYAIILGGSVFLLFPPVYKQINEVGFFIMGKILEQLRLNTAFSQYLIRANIAGVVGKKVILFWSLAFISMLWLAKNKKLYRILNWYLIGLFSIPFLILVPLPNRIYDYELVSSIPLLYYTFSYSRTNHVDWKLKIIILGIILCLYIFLVWSVIFTWRT